MPVHIMMPFSREKNLGKCYNEAMAMIPDGDHACLRDIDTLLLTANTPNIIEDYVARYPNALLTCFTNRVSSLSRAQLLNGISENSDIRYHIAIAEKQEAITTATPIRIAISGFMMVLSKALWQRFPFAETGKCLGIDTIFSRTLLANNVPIYRMDAVYCWHTYRLMNGIHNKSHLI